MAAKIAKPFKPLSLLRGGGGGGRDEKGWVLCVNLNVTIPTSDYSESIWDDWFVISFTDMAVKIAKPFKPLSLLRGGGGGGGGGGMRGGGFCV